MTRTVEIDPSELAELLAECRADTDEAEVSTTDNVGLAGGVDR